jgi:8-oxo-dGTP pyrophosphatase MutT (NUDIX family)
MRASHISIEKAKKDKLFYFVANVVVYKDGKCLILKRDEREKVHPGKYGVPGGKLEWKDLDIEHPTRINGDVIDFQDAVEDLLVREAKEEAGIAIATDLHYINSVAFIRPDGIPVMLVKFAAKYAGGDVVLEQGAFTDYAWVDAQEVLSYDCIEGVAEEVRKTIEIFTVSTAV